MGLEERKGLLYYYRKETGDFGDFDGVRINVDALLAGLEPESLESLVSTQSQNQHATSPYGAN